MNNNERKRIIYISEVNMGGRNPADEATPRSGYAHIALNLCRELSKDIEVKVIGINYMGQEHHEPYSILPTRNMQEVVRRVETLKNLWGADTVIVALDIHVYQETLLRPLKELGMKYICITPLESDPLCLTWANILSQMDAVLFISQLGADEARKVGIDAKHLEIGIDTKQWRMRTKEDYIAGREMFGIEDEFVVLTVADNQERKNLGRGLEIISQLKNLHGIKIKHLLVTRDPSPVGWKLYDLAYELGISSELLVIPNGITHENLYKIYSAADVYLSCSKGEGLGYPILEAMAAGVPVVANTAGALPELLADERGWLVPYRYWYYDPFGNQRRYDISVEDAVRTLLEVKDNKAEVERRVNRAREYVEGRTWDKAARQVLEAIEHFG